TARCASTPAWTATSPNPSNARSCSPKWGASWPMEANMQPFDEKELLDRVDNDWEFLADTVQMLETDGRALMVEIRRAADAGDAPTLGRAGHTIKGMIS